MSSTPNVANYIKNLKPSRRKAFCLLFVYVVLVSIPTRQFSFRQVPKVKHYYVTYQYVSFCVVCNILRNKIFMLLIHNKSYPPVVALSYLVGRLRVMAAALGVKRKLKDNGSSTRTFVTLVKKQDRGITNLAKFLKSVLESLYAFNSKATNIFFIKDHKLRSIQPSFLRVTCFLKYISMLTMSHNKNSVCA